MTDTLIERPNESESTTTLSKNEPLRVMVGIIWNEAKTHVLISKRLTGKSFAGLWEFPGGKVEMLDGVVEDDIAALSRELAEELNIFITDFEHWFDIVHHYKDALCDQLIHLIVYDVWAFDEAPVGLEGQEIQWIPVSELDPIYFPKANRELIEKLKARQESV